MASNKRTTKPKKTMSERERRVRQMVAYFIYYLGGIIRLDTAASLCFFASHIVVGPDQKPIIDANINTFDTHDVLSVIRILKKLGTSADFGTSPQFAYLGDDNLACKELPKDFYENFFSPEDKQKLDWALVLYSEIKDNGMFDAMVPNPNTIYPQTKANFPAKTWEGFDPLTAEAEAERLRKERRAALPKFTGWGNEDN